MATVRELLVQLGVEADDRGLKAFDRTLRKVRANMVVAAQSAAMLAAGVGLVGAAVVKLSNDTGRAAREVKLLSNFLDTSVQDTQALMFTFSQFGGDADDVADALATISDRAEDAIEGTKSFVQDFKLIGIAVDDLKGKNPIQLFDLYADAIANTEMTTRQIGAAVRILGDDVGRKLAPLLKGGSARIKEYMQTYRALGVAMDEDAIAKADAWGRELVFLREIVKSLRNVIGLAFIPVLTRAAQAFRDWFVVNKAMLRLSMEDWAKRVEKGVLKLVKAFKIADRFVRTRLQGWSTIFETIAGTIATALSARIFVALTSAVFGLSAAFVNLAGVVGAAFGLAGMSAIGGGLLLLTSILIGLVQIVGALVSIFAPLTAAVDDFLVLLRGGDSIMGSFLDMFIDQEVMAAALNEQLTALKDAAWAVLEAMSAAGRAIRAVFMAALVDLLAGPLGPLLIILKEMGKIILNDIVENIKSATMWLGNLTGLLGSFSVVANQGAQALENRTQDRLAAQGMGRTVEQDRQREQARQQILSTHGDVIVNGSELSLEQLTSVVTQIQQAQLRDTMNLAAGGAG